MCQVQDADLNTIVVHFVLYVELLKSGDSSEINGKSFGSQGTVTSCCGLLCI